MTSFTVGYTIYNRQDSIIPILEGIAKCFSKDCEVVMHFDACTDLSRPIFESNKGILGKRQIVVRETNPDFFELRGNNLLIGTFTSDVLVIFQDDMVCADSKICSTIEGLIARYGNSLGLIGGRDGFELSEEKRVKFVKNYWSPSRTAGYYLKLGESRERTFVNRGPIVLTRSLIDKIGGFNTDYCPGTYDDRDFCCQAKFTHSLTNVVMQTHVDERRQGKTSKLREPMLYTLNAMTFWKKWGERLGYEPKWQLGRAMLELLAKNKRLRDLLIFKN